MTVGHKDAAARRKPHVDYSSPPGPVAHRLAVLHDFARVPIADTLLREAHHLGRGG
jgi:hypothetical protein